MGVLAQVIGGLLAGVIIAFVHGWLVTLLILLVVPVLMVVMTIQNKLVLGTGGTGKKAYEKAGSVGAPACTKSVLNSQTVSDCL